MRRLFAGTSMSPRQKRAMRDIVFVIAIAFLLFLIWLVISHFAGLPDPSGTIKLESALIIEGPGTGVMPKFNRPLAAAWGPDGRIYVSDTGNSRVCVFDTNGRFLSETTGASSETTAEALSQPAGLFVTNEREVFVADIRAGAVFVLDSSGVTTRTLAPGFAGADSGWHPTDVAMVDGLVYATDVDGVAIFRPDGASLGRLSQAGMPVTLSRPNGITPGPDGSLVISDTNAQRVASYSVDGDLLWQLGPASGKDEPFSLPRGLSYDGDGTILVADAFRFGITAISTAGELLDTYSSRGQAKAQFEYPNDIDVRAGMWLVTDKDNNRIQVLRLVNSLDR